MASIIDSVTEGLGLLAFFGTCGTRMVADLIIGEIQEYCHIHPETGKAETLLQKLRGVMGAVRLSPPAPPAFRDCVSDAMQAVVNSIVTHGLDARQVTAGAVLGVLRVARECSLPERDALAEVSRALIGHTDTGGGDLAATACGIVEGAIEDARLSHRCLPTATSAAILAVAESSSQCDRDAVEDLAHGMARFVRVEADHFVVAACPPERAGALRQDRRPRAVLGRIPRIIEHDFIDAETGYAAAPNSEELKMRLKGIRQTTGRILG
jgi:hypothetical protein